MRARFKKQSGFTLIEIAIVLVVIGLLLGGVLKGTELIENSKVRKTSSMVDGTIAAYYSYQDRYSRIPGDDGNLAALTARGGDWTQVTQAGNNNGTLAVSLAQTFTGGGENTDFWQHLRAAGFITGDPSAVNAAALPRNPFGGLIGITTATMGNGLNGLKLCLSQIPGKAAITLDSQLDDGAGDTGRLRGTLGVDGQNTAPTNAALAAPYNQNNTYTMCLQV